MARTFWLTYLLLPLKVEGIDHNVAKHVDNPVNKQVTGPPVLKFLALEAASSASARMLRLISCCKVAPRAKV
jgi:hypothetical protein